MLLLAGCRTSAPPELAEAIAPPLAALDSLAEGRGYARSTGGFDGRQHTRLADINWDTEEDALAFVIGQDTVAIAVCLSTGRGYECMIDMERPLGMREVAIRNAPGEPPTYWYERCELLDFPDLTQRPRVRFQEMCYFSGLIYDVIEGQIEPTGTIN